MKKTTLLSLLFYMLIIYSQNAKAQEVPKITFSHSLSISTSNQDSKNNSNCYLENATYNNNYNISISKEAFVLKCGLKASCVFFQHIFPHAFQQGYTQAFPQIVDNSLKNMAISLGLSFKTDFPYAQVVYNLGTLSLKNGIQLLKNPTNISNTALTKSPSPENATVASLSSAISKKNVWSGNITVTSKTNYFPNISLGGSWNNEAYLSIYRYFTSKKTSAYLLSWGYSVTGGFHYHESPKQISWFTENPYYKPDYIQGYESSFFTKTLHSTNNIKFGITESPFDTPLLWCKDNIMLNLSNLNLSAYFFMAPQGKYTLNGSILQKKMQFYINPAINFKINKSKIKTGLLWEYDILLKNEIENTLIFELNLTSKKNSINLKTIGKINQSTKKWQFTKTFSYGSLLTFGKNNGEISFKLDQDQNKTIKISENIYFSNMLINSIGLNGDVKIKNKNNIIYFTKTIGTFFELGQSVKNLKWKAKIEFSSIF